MKTAVVLGGATFQEQGHNRFVIPFVFGLLPIIEQYSGKVLKRNTVQEQRQYRFVNHRDLGTKRQGT